MQHIHQIVREINEATHFINSSIYQKYNSLLDETITASQNLLLTTVHHFTTMTLREIADTLDITPSAASQQVSKLVNESYLKRETNEKNRREILISLDTKGKEYIEKQEKIDLIITKKLYAKLGEEKLGMFRDILMELKQIAVDELA